MGSGGREFGGRELGYVDFDIEVRKKFFVVKWLVLWIRSCIGIYGYSEVWGMKDIDLF